jgi:GNAT superfamily N-acetyltransferase
MATEPPRIESPEAAKKRGDDEAYRFGKPPEHLPSLADAAPGRVSDFGGVQISSLDLRSRSDRARFIECADRFYENDPNYIAPLRMHMMKFLDPAQNPAFENLEVHPIIATRGGRIVGRMTVHYDRAYAKYHETETAFFGFFECANDKQAAHAMLDHAVRWAKDKGCIEIFGPMNFTMNHQVGLLVQNFDRPPFVEELYNPRYYEELLTSYGFGKAKDWFVWWMVSENGMDSENRRRIQRIAEKVKKREGITLRTINLKEAEKEIKVLYELYLACWQKNWSFVPLSEREFTWLAQDLKTIAIPDLIFFVEVAGKPVGFCATLPNINEALPKNGRLFPFAWMKLLTGALKKTKYARLYTLGMLPEYRKRGLESMMFAETLLASQRLGFKAGEIGMTLEDNTLINRAIESMDGHLDRVYRILGLKL